MAQKRSANPRKLPQQDRSRITVEAILEATAHILAQDGYEKANTNHIAERAGVSIGSLYQYFPNKESLMAALMEQHSKEIAALVESKLKGLSDAPFNVAIPELVSAVIAAHALNPRLHQVLNEEIPRSARLQQMQKADEHIAKLVRDYLGRSQSQLCPQNLDMTVFILCRTVESLCHSAVIEHPQFVSDRQFEDEVSRLLLRYLTEA